MIRKITAFALAIFAVLLLAGCVPADGDSETTALDTVTDTTAAMTTEVPVTDGIKYFDIREADGGYVYSLYNLDGSVAEEEVFCEDVPSFDLLEEKTIRVAIGNEVYYYDLEKRVFSETFTDVFSEYGNLLLRAQGEKIVVCDIFDSEGFYTEIGDFSYPLSSFVSLEFIEDGKSVKVHYLSGEDEMIECFNVTSGTRFTVLEDWRNKKELLSGAEREGVESFLYGYMGTVDYNTGFEYSYTVSGALMINGERFYHCECFYVMEKDGETALVPCAEFVVSEDKSQRYDCRSDDGVLIVYTENDMM